MKPRGIKSRYLLLILGIIIAVISLVIWAAPSEEQGGVGPTSNTVAPALLVGKDIIRQAAKQFATGDPAR